MKESTASQLLSIQNRLAGTRVGWVFSLSLMNLIFTASY